MATLGNAQTNADVDALMEQVRELHDEMSTRFKWTDDNGRGGAMYFINRANHLIAKARRCRTCATRGHWLTLAIESLNRSLRSLQGEGAYRSGQR